MEDPTERVIIELYKKEIEMFLGTMGIVKRQKIRHRK